MGEAKRRGTLEQRIVQATERVALENQVRLEEKKARMLRFQKEREAREEELRMKREKGKPRKDRTGATHC